MACWVFATFFTCFFFFGTCFLPAFDRREKRKGKQVPPFGNKYPGNQVAVPVKNRIHRKSKTSECVASETNGRKLTVGACAAGRLDAARQSTPSRLAHGSGRSSLTQERRRSGTRGPLLWSLCRANITEMTVRRSGSCGMWTEAATGCSGRTSGQGGCACGGTMCSVPVCSVCVNPGCAGRCGVFFRGTEHFNKNCGQNEKRI